MRCRVGVVRVENFPCTNKIVSQTFVSVPRRKREANFPILWNWIYGDRWTMDDKKGLCMLFVLHLSYEGPWTKLLSKEMLIRFCWALHTSHSLPSGYNAQETIDKFYAVLKTQPPMSSISPSLHPPFHLNNRKIQNSFLLSRGTWMSKWARRASSMNFITIDIWTVELDESFPNSFPRSDFHWKKIEIYLNEQLWELIPNESWERMLQCWNNFIDSNR